MQVPTPPLMRRIGLAVAIPAHARVNSQCYPVWNADRSDLQLVWRGAMYTHGFHVFDTQPDSSFIARRADGCVQRLWCTDSGAAGWYGRSGHDYSVPLTAAWLGHESPTYRRSLKVINDNTTMRYTNQHGPGTLVVAGSTLFFYTFAHTGKATALGLPRLSSLVFSEWENNTKETDLVSEELKAFDVLGYRNDYWWFSYASPLYPSGPGAVTLSIEDWYDGNAWAVDVVVNNGARGALVHYSTSDCPSVISANREVATFPDYSCHATDNGVVQCAALGMGRYTWENSGSIVRSIGMNFSPLNPFKVPGTLWLHSGMDSDGIAYMALVGFGHAPELGVVGDTLVAVEARNASSCPSGSRLHLVTRALPGGAVIRAEPLGCEWRQVAPAVYHFEPTYGALAVKWAGPWVESPLFTAVNLEHDIYHLRGQVESEKGDASREHVAWSYAGGIIALYTGGRTLYCLTVGQTGIPDDIAVAVGSARAGQTQCVRALVPARVAPDAVYDKCPLLAQGAGNSRITEALLTVDADPNIKCTNATTPLMRSLGNVGVVSLLLHAGAAVCSWPLNVASVRSPHDNQRHGYERAVAAAPTAPCEPGWWLAPGEGCVGLTICPPGYYCPGHRARTNVALPCPPGTYGPQYGKASIIQCRPCPLERPYSAPGAAEMAECMESAASAPESPLIDSTHHTTS